MALARAKRGLAAPPGTSNHGSGFAVDLCGGIESFGTKAHAWMKANAGRYGWNHPGWAEPRGSSPEPWHWEWIGDGGTLFANGATPSSRIRTDEAPPAYEPDPVLSATV